MAVLGPFGAIPRLAVGVSGGADSTALALLADQWARRRGGAILALIVDHGLRQSSAREAASTAERLGRMGIAHEVIRLGLAPGPALQARARAARHEALAASARAAGMVHLLLGHHAADQEELRAMRALRGPRGAEGMAGFAARSDVILLRPLLGFRPEDLRTRLRMLRIGWIEDPSNADPRFERARVRAAGPQIDPEAAIRAAGRRATADRSAASFLALTVLLRPEGWAVVRSDRLPADALGVLIRVVGGAIYPPARAAIDRLARRLEPATLGGVRILPAGRYGPGWLLVREEAACAVPCEAREGAVWDGRFRVRAVPPQARSIGALGDAGADIRSGRNLPAVVRRTLPAALDDEAVRAVPHLGHGTPSTILFAPPGPAAPAPFGPLPDGGQICSRRAVAG